MNSNCCNAKTIVRGCTTLHYECSKCGKPCDIAKELTLADPLNGTWQVRVTSGFFLGLNMLGDRKIISGLSGHNLLNNSSWGYFTITRRREDKYDLDYNTEQNHSLLRPIKDIIKKIDDNKWSGVFYYNNRPILNFELHRIGIEL